MKAHYLVLLLIFSSISLKAYSDVGAPWGIKMVALQNGETRHIKFNTETGETWWAKNTNWVKIQETDPISRSSYEFTMVSTGLSWRTIRIDKLTGKSWKNSSGKWVAFTSKATNKE